MSWVTRARVRGPLVSSSCPGRLGPVSNGPRCRSAVPGDSGPCPRSRGVDQLSLMTRTSVRVLEVSTSSPRLLTIQSEGLRGRPAVLDDSRLGQIFRDVDQLSQTIRDRVRGPAGLTRCPGDSGPGPIAHGVHQQSWENRACAGGHTVSTMGPGRLGTVNKGPWCFQFSRVTPACVRGPAGWTRSPR